MGHLSKKIPFLPLKGSRDSGRFSRFAADTSFAGYIFKKPTETVTKNSKLKFFKFIFCKLRPKGVQISVYRTICQCTIYFILKFDSLLPNLAKLRVAVVTLLGKFGDSDSRH